VNSLAGFPDKIRHLQSRVAIKDVRRGRRHHIRLVDVIPTFPKLLLLWLRSVRKKPLFHAFDVK
jgi:hypothetical protein